jgi:hypothetical protein
VSASRARRLAAASAADRIRLVEGLREAGVASFMAAHGIDRPTAVARIKATRRLGRRPSRAADDER